MMTSATVATLTNGYLPHTCTIVELVDGLDASGDPEYDPYEAAVTTYAPSPSGSNIAEVPCFCWRPAGLGEAAVPGRATDAHDWYLLVPAGTVVGEADRIQDVHDEADVTIVAGPLDIREVAPRRGHILLGCDEVVSGEDAP